MNESYGYGWTWEVFPTEGVYWFVAGYFQEEIVEPQYISCLK